jgi:signal peptidase I
MNDEQHTLDERIEKEKESTKSDFWELLKFTLIALIIVIPIRLFVAQPFVVSGASMHPTFENGDYLIVDEISYRFHDPQRGDVIILRPPTNTSTFYIKRIVGLPGERISFDNDTITVYNEANPDGVSWIEPYIGDAPTTNFDVSLDEDEYFVLGDNRNASSDSRSWGPLPAENIVGRPAIRLLPTREIGILPGDYKLAENE